VRGPKVWCDGIFHQTSPASLAAAIRLRAASAPFSARSAVSRRKLVSRLRTAPSQSVALPPAPDSRTSHPARLNDRESALSGCAGRFWRWRQRAARLVLVSSQLVGPDYRHQAVLRCVVWVRICRATTCPAALILRRDWPFSLLPMVNASPGHLDAGRIFLIRASPWHPVSLRRRNE
jgi:hypothetical protein